jgi:hypothetical protein
MVIINIPPFIVGFASGALASPACRGGRHATLATIAEAEGFARERNWIS